MCRYPPPSAEKSDSGQQVSSVQQSLEQMYLSPSTGQAPQWTRGPQQADPSPGGLHASWSLHLHVVCCMEPAAADGVAWLSASGVPWLPRLVPCWAPRLMAAGRCLPMHSDLATEAAFTAAYPRASCFLLVHCTLLLACTQRSLTLALCAESDVSITGHLQLPSPSTSGLHDPCVAYAVLSRPMPDYALQYEFSRQALALSKAPASQPMQTPSTAVSCTLCTPGLRLSMAS